MTIRPVAGLSRIGLRTADGCFCPLMLESFRGVRELVLTTTNSEQQAVEVDLFLEEPGGGERYQHLGTVHLDETAVVGCRPDLMLRVSLAADRVLTAVLTGPAGRGELLVALQRYSSGDARMRSAPNLPSALEAVAAGLLDGEPHASQAPAAAAWRASGGRADDDRVTSLPQFIHRSTSTMPVNTLPYDPARILWLAERADLSWAEAELIRSVCLRLADDPDPARADVARVAMHRLEERSADGRDEHNTDKLDNDLPSGTAFLRRDYGQVLRLLHAARQTSAASGILAELANYWLEK